MRKLLLTSAALAFGTGAVLAQENPEVEDGPGPNLVIELADSTGTAKGTLVLDLYPDLAPAHVERLTELAGSGAYDGVVFHRVIEGFMAQTGDVQHGKQDGEISMAGTGGSDLPDLPAEFSDRPFQRGTVGMARAMDPDSANSQFFINFDRTPSLDGQYTVVGQLIEGWDVLDEIRRGDPSRAGNGRVDSPDYMLSVTVVDGDA